MIHSRFGEIKMSEIEYKIEFAKQGINFNDNTLTLSVEHMKSRTLSTVYFKFRLYDMDDNLIHTYVSDRWVIDNTYSTYYTTFTLDEKIVRESSYYKIEFYTDLITSENPLYFNGVMLKEGEHDDYHKPSDRKENMDVEFNKSSYANLYGDNGIYLQVIRPKHDKITTSTLYGSSCTVLAPHILDESKYDDPVDLFLEFINQTDQRIDVLR